ncbi:MAG: hemerythrin family protein [Halopseudomonas sp.]
MNHPQTEQENATINREHAVQIGMVDLLNQAITEDRPDSEKVKILDQLIDYTDVHFMSEQLIMRQHSYEEFEAHDNDHDALMERLKDLKQQAQASALFNENKALMELRGLLLSHIATYDRKLSTYLHSLQATHSPG